MSNLYQLHLTPFDPLWHELDGEYLAYDRASGSTHCFDMVTAKLLMKLHDGPVREQELVEYIAEILHFDIDNDLVDHVNEVLRELQRNDFVNIRQS